MPLPADLRSAASELDRSVQALKNIGCDDEQLLAGNTMMANLIRQGAEEIDRLQEIEGANILNREALKKSQAEIEALRLQASIDNALLELKEERDALLKERESFWMDYRVKCDGQLKAMMQERDALRAITDQDHKNLDAMRAEVERLAGSLAVCGVVAREGDGTCLPEYETDSLRAVRAMRARLAAYDAAKGGQQP